MYTKEMKTYVCNMTWTRIFTATFFFFYKSQQLETVQVQKWKNGWMHCGTSVQWNTIQKEQTIDTENFRDEPQKH